MSDSALWELGARSDSTFSVGIRAPGTKRGIVNGTWLVAREERGSRLQALSRLKGILEVAADSSLPRLLVKVANVETISSLRGLPFVDYVEPRRFPKELLVLSSFGGCSRNYSGSSYSVDPVSGDQLPVTFMKTKVDRAWAYSNGSGVWIGITDTGVNPSNSQLTLDFTLGMGAGRAPLVQYNLVPTTAVGDCSHGTFMAAVAAAPRNGHGTEGVAWKANLLAVQMESGVVNMSAGDATAGVNYAVNYGAKVIAMAFGVLIHSSALTDAIQRGYSQFDVVFVGAAGTSPAGLSQNWIVYPANLTEVMAASAANYDGTRDNQSHYGPGLDIVSYSPTTTSSYFGDGNNEFGNSSNATAMISGIAALVRSKYPFISADSVRKRIINTAGTSCNAATAFGPVVNAEAAVGGICVQYGQPLGSVNITFDRQVYGDTRTQQTAEYCVNASGGLGAREITWGSGVQGTCQTVTFYRGTYVQRVHVTVRDTGVSMGGSQYYLDVQVVDLDNSSCPTCF